MGTQHLWQEGLEISVLCPKQHRNREALFSLLSHISHAQSAPFQSPKPGRDHMRSVKVGTFTVSKSLMRLLNVGLLAFPPKDRHKFQLTT